MIGLLSVSLHIPQAGSLKDKRQVVKSLVDGIRRRFNVSVAEMDDLDLYQRATLGAVCIGNETAHVRRVLDAVRGVIESRPEVELVHASVEML